MTPGIPVWVGGVLAAPFQSFGALLSIWSEVVLFWGLCSWQLQFMRREPFGFLFSSFQFKRSIKLHVTVMMRFAIAAKLNFYSISTPKDKGFIFFFVLQSFLQLLATLYLCHSYSHLSHFPLPSVWVLTTNFPLPSSIHFVHLYCLFPLESALQVTHVHHPAY